MVFHWPVIFTVRATCIAFIVAGPAMSSADRLWALCQARTADVVASP
ncbi:hypothetical protein [Streptomyces sp. NPDC059909]